MTVDIQSFQLQSLRKQKLVDQINESKYISVICDGCTDTAAIEEEIVYVRSVNGRLFFIKTWTL
jgi:hypothetical protein